MNKIGFIGIGTMGRPMATRLIEAGHELTAFDIDPEKVASLGCTSAGSVSDAVRGADLVILSLPSPAAVESAILGSGGVMSEAPTGSICIDMSTCSPHLAISVAGKLSSNGIHFLDAPVSGGPRAMETSTLTVIVGGSPHVVEVARPILETIGGTVVHVGDVGAGQAVKLCNNLISASTMAAIAEACSLAVRQGIDPDVFYGVLTSSMADSRVLRTRFPIPGVDARHPASSGFAALFTVDLMMKDLALALDAAHDLDVPAPVTEATAARFRSAQEAGRGGLDYSAVFDPPIASE